MQVNEKAVRKSVVLTGAVQGVGFRPFVYRLATSRGISGSVRNTASGVLIEVQGREELLQRFMAELVTQHPPLARPVVQSVCDLPLRADHSEFAIKTSHSGTPVGVPISPDAAICRQCRDELLDPADRRWRYPFINCINCGPRYTITFDVPYDRPNTVMRNFPMCQRCRREYDSPDDRRFHAQPNACPECGPHPWLTDAKGGIIDCDDPVRHAVALLEAGHILAVKGLGGFHLAVRADDDAAVQRLRHRKYRKTKAFAIMVPNVGTARGLAWVNQLRERALSGPAAPIVLCPKKQTGPLSPAVAPDSPFWGIMLPYTPLHVLLMQGNYPALVMTSGNNRDEPIEKDNDSALMRLGELCDFFLMHNRDIHTSCDDSIVAIALGESRILRRARGMAPRPIPVRRKTDRCILALGAELKNTICILARDEAHVSPHLGDISNATAYDNLLHTTAKMLKLVNANVHRVACDMHPALLTSRLAQSWAPHQPIAVQHHHAHIAAVMGEHHLEGPVIGLAADGLGYGPDGTIWGGELLMAWRDRYQRCGWLETVAQPGGDQAARQPWRMAASWLHHSQPAQARTRAKRWLSGVKPELLESVLTMCERRINCPQTSSMGRLFDAVSALLGLALENTHEASAAMALEQAVDPEEPPCYHVEVADDPQGCLVLRGSQLVEHIIADLESGVDASRIAGRFHHAMADGLAQWALALAQRRQVSTVALGGGVFQNQFILERLHERLAGFGLKVFYNRDLPCNDGGIAFGQAIVADAVTCCEE